MPHLRERELEDRLRQIQSHLRRPLQQKDVPLDLAALVASTGGLADWRSRLDRSVEVVRDAEDRVAPLIERFVRENNRLPKSRELSSLQPGLSAYVHIAGGLRRFARELGLDLPAQRGTPGARRPSGARRHRVNDQAVEALLRAFLAEHGRLPRTDEMEGVQLGLRSAVLRGGGIAEWARRIDVAPPRVGAGNGMTEAEVLAHLSDLRSHHNRRLKSNDCREIPGLWAAVRRTGGLHYWNAKIAALDDKSSPDA